MADDGRKMKALIILADSRQPTVVQPLSRYSLNSGYPVYRWVIWG